jgi:hypothetical protein
MRSDNSIDAFDELFFAGGASITFSDAYEVGFTKIAVFAKGLTPTHAARQLNNGMWTSKLGSAIDVSHNIFDLEGPEYGAVIRFYKVAVTA